ncbi:hypothetical protein PACTADRAFT_45281 [Pachysolen tannophilus NRRL Y-2460]|uniref:Endonuclease/exonuclease/phosphatase domain-containing protein n=1 Tax=Pachysolen tannophilus NRRL Y-2460 TaxID=669874 RepID=A0A1E4TR97_PACTA|nr:hypothetical protein PACTADRAFT_45281 [Pachysolen tannophilus NRRL Y-2460]
MNQGVNGIADAAQDSSIDNEVVAVQKGNKKDKQKQKKNGKRRPETLTPEYIEQQRALRNAAKEKKLAEMVAKGIDISQIDTPDYLRFITRNVLPIPHPNRGKDDDEKGIENLNVKIMTYNLLAQALIRRTLFPTNGNALKWSRRSQVLLNELKYYNCDILCLQEVDFTQYNSFWKERMKNLGYDNQYYRSGVKNHGIAIFYRSDLFKCIDICHIDYDKESTGNVEQVTLSTNVGLILALEFQDSIKRQFPKSTKKGCMVFTTHLFWHPFGTFTRTLQTYIMLKKYKEFIHRVNVLHQTTDECWFKFAAGDFNSQPYDAPYLSITEKPVSYDSRCRTVISCSTAFQFSQLRGTGIDEEKEENIELVGENQPKDPVPESFKATPEQQQMVQDVTNLHNSLDMRVISLYSVAYKYVHGENTDNNKGEPIFSNWAHAWRGLLDYIFVVKHWDLKEDCKNVDDLEKFEMENDIEIKGLLKMPLPQEMGPEPSGQPREGMYASDHLCMIADLGLKMK